ncbi:MAG: endonuclease/exonuclease/phosphatase family protein, partial [bacterium]
TINGGADLAAWLLWRFPEYRLAYGPLHGDLWGNVILSRFDLQGTGAVRFPIRARRMQRGLTWATVPAEGENILIINAHLAHGAVEEERFAQAGDLLEFLRGRHPAIILGDFNAGPGSPPIARLREGGLSDALAPHGLAAAFTYPSLRPSERRDYIFITGNLASTSAGIPRATASDHLPVIATIHVR